MTSPGPRYWILVLARAVPAALVALVITFTPDHSVRLGALCLGVFALVTAGLLIPTAALELTGLSRTLVLVQGIVFVLGAAAAFALMGSTVAALLIVMSATFVVTGVLELVAGLTARGRSPLARDWVFLGGASTLFGLAVLLVPADYRQAITIPDEVVPDLTASVIVVGALGAYAAIVAVYLVIAALSIKWAPRAGVVEETR